MLGDTPYIQYGMQEDLKRLFYSEYDSALTVPGTLLPGYGIVPMGMVLAQVTEAASGRKNFFVPYTPVRPTAGYKVQTGAAFLLQDGAADKSVWVTMEDSYKFAVGDHLAVADNTNYSDQGTGAVDLGAITAIDRSTYPHKALVTVTNNVTTNFTVARGAWVWIQTKTAAPFTAAKSILVGGTDTGEGEYAKGGNGVQLLSNALLYTAGVIGLDSDVKTALSVAENGRFLVVK